MRLQSFLGSYVGLVAKLFHFNALRNRILVHNSHLLSSVVILEQ